MNFSLSPYASCSIDGYRKSHSTRIRLFCLSSADLLAGKLNDRLRERIFVFPPDRTVALRAARLVGQPACAARLSERNGFPLRSILDIVYDESGSLIQLIERKDLRSVQVPSIQFERPVLLYIDARRCLKLR